VIFLVDSSRKEFLTHKTECGLKYFLKKVNDHSLHLQNKNLKWPGFNNGELMIILKQIKETTDNSQKTKQISNFKE
jgi:hypothetical protein